MAIRVTSDDDVRLAFLLSNRDPFLLAPPSWLVRVAPLLPPEVLNTSGVPKERITVMPIRKVNETEAPKRLHVRGGISSKQDYLDVLNELNKNEKGVALVVDMDRDSWVDEKQQPIKNPEIVFAGSLRRRFDAAGLSVTAYQSGSMQITVRKLTTLELREREAARKKASHK